MSRKDITDVAENIDLTPDIGPVLKLLGDVFTKQYQTTNGIHLNKEERKDRGSKPIAEVQRSDIQIRVGNQLFTVEPSDESKAMVSIPVGMSDKATPAIIPREWMIGMYIDVLIDMCEGDTTLAYKWAEGINAAINNAMQVNDEGRVKIDQSLLPDLRHPIAVGEMMESFKRTFLSKSAGSVKLHFTIDVQELEEKPDEVEVIAIEPISSPADLLAARADALLANDSTPKEEQEVGGVSHSLTEPEPASIEVASPQTDDVEEVVVVVADPTPPVDEIVENPHNFKKQPVAWIKHQLAAEYFNAAITINDIAELAGCHVQTIKRALEQFEAEAEFCETIPHEEGDYLHTWTELGFTLSDTHRLLITCERSPTGRYARGRPIHFIIRPKEDLPFGGPTVDDDAPVLKEADDTDPSLHACPDCGIAISSEQAVTDAPDWICEECHAVRMDEDEEWAEQTKERGGQRAIYEAKPIENVPVITNNPIPFEALVDDEPEYAPEQTDAEITADYAMIEAMNVDQDEMNARLEERDFTPAPTRESVTEEWESVIADAESYTEIHASPPFEIQFNPELGGGQDIDTFIDTPIAAIEGKTGRCVVSAEPGKFIALTAIGERWFASEQHWAEYTGNPVMPEGHYGLQAAHDEEVELQRENDEATKDNDGFDFSNAMGF